MAGDNVTTKFRVDISDLKKNISAANAAVKQYKAELANASAGMKKGEENADSLSKKIEAQEKIVSAEKDKLDALKAQLARYEEAVEKGAGVVETLTRKHKAAADQYGENSDEATKYAEQLAKAQAAQERNEKAADDLRTRMINQDTAVKNAAAQLGTFKEQLGELESGSGKAEEELDELEKEEKDVGEQAQKTTDGGLSAFGVALGNLAADIIANVVDKLGELITKTIETGSAFESSMSNVGAISGATADEMDLLTERAKELGESTQFTASQVGDAFSYMAMAGWKTEDMTEGIDGILSLAAASGADLATTSDIVTDALTAFGESAGEAGRLADVMAAASSNANTNVELMGETFKYVAPLAGSMGYSMEDTAVAVGLMANAGIKGSQAGTSLRSVITRLAAPTKDSAAAMAELGISITKTNEDGTESVKSLSETIGDLREAFGEINMPVDEFNTKMAELEAQQASYDEALEAGELTQAQYDKNIKKLSESQEELMTRAYGAEGAMKAQYASMIAGKNSLSGFLALVNASDEDFEKLTNAVNDSSGAAANMAEIMNDNLQGDMTKLESAFEGLQIAIFEKFDAPLREVVQTVTNEVMPILRDLIDGVDGAAERLGGKVAEILGNVLSGITEVLPTIIEGVSELIGQLAVTLIDMTPDLVKASGEMWTTVIDSLGEFLPQIIDGITEALPEIVGAVTELIPQLIESIEQALPKILDPLGKLGETVFDEIAEALPQIVAMLGRLLEKIGAKLPEIVSKLAKSVPKALQSVAKLITDNLPQILQTVVEAVQMILTELPGMIRDIIGQLPDIIKTVQDFIIDNLPVIVEAVTDLLRTLGEMMPELMTALTDQLPDIVRALADLLVECTPILVEAVGDILMQVLMNIPNMFKAHWDLITGIFDMIIKPAREGIDDLGELFSLTLEEPLADLGQSFVDFGDFIDGFFESLVDDVLSFFDPMWEFFDEFGDSVKEAVYDPVKEWLEKAGYFILDLWDSIVETFTEAPDKFAEWFKGAWKNIKDAFKDVGSFFGDMWETVKEKFSDIGTKVGEAIGGTFKKAINAVLETVEKAINAVPNAVNNAIDLLNELPRVDIGTMSTISLPRLAKGGIVDKGTLAMVGEAGKEAVLPLERNKAGLKEIADLLADEILGSNAVKNGSSEVRNTYTFNQTVSSPKALSQWEIYRQTKNLVNAVKGV